MTKIEFTVAALLIVAGLLCLAASGSWLFNPGALELLKTFIQVCLWMGIPLVLTGGLYWWFKKKRRY
ncbi:hypothetical protein [Planococcus lenghuensis]|uniref:Uncharacterized protein n=1 Tax=Planococcus lenghuensis TaxID=2213202 RepID=A0A1Q2KYH3_9BACL|nr:hypothetical protein [Planococcus lenghuensis]AQQ53239.1 hypothetical protein B0X71_09215 [Planococcus lenghuensis]